ncbi:hypothetical protein V6N13_088683 [Hibiscus sabdariffa]|uniref:Uncharacterized protein n=1 Tax=Hibiscus sabdariffa TaxID=183260 RepID=A0ABR2G012_9ROSI
MPKKKAKVRFNEVGKLEVRQLMDEVKEMKEIKTSFASLERKVDEMEKLIRAVLDAVKVRGDVDEQPKVSGPSEVEKLKEIRKDEHAICDYVWNIDLKEEAVIVDFGLVHVTKGEMDLLQPGQWVHGGIIDVVGWVLAYESRKKRRSSKVGYIPFNISEVLSTEGISLCYAAEVYGAQLKEFGGLINYDTVRINSV